MAFRNGAAGSVFPRKCKHLMFPSSSSGDRKQVSWRGPPGSLSARSLAEWEEEQSPVSVLLGPCSSQGHNPTTDEMPMTIPSMQEDFWGGRGGYSLDSFLMQKGHGDPKPGTLGEQTLRCKSTKLFPKCKVDHCVQRGGPCEGEAGWNQHVDG